MALKFIEVIDETCELDEGNPRHVSFAYNGKKDKAHQLRVIGGLPHQTAITFDETNAIKMIEFLQEYILHQKLWRLTECTKGYAFYYHITKRIYNCCRIGDKFDQDTEGGYYSLQSVKQRKGVV